MSEGKFEYRSRVAAPSNFISISNAHSTQAVKRIVNSSKSSSSAANNTKWFLFSDKQLFSSALKRLITKLTQSRRVLENSDEKERGRRGHKTINGTQFRNEKTHFERQFELLQSIHAYQRASSFRCFSFSHRSLAFFSTRFFFCFSLHFTSLLFWSSTVVSRSSTNQASVRVSMKNSFSCYSRSQRGGLVYGVHFPINVNILLRDYDRHTFELRWLYCANVPHITVRTAAPHAAELVTLQCEILCVRTRFIIFDVLTARIVNV